MKAIRNIFNDAYQVISKYCLTIGLNVHCNSEKIRSFYINYGDNPIRIASEGAQYYYVFSHLLGVTMSQTRRVSPSSDTSKPSCNTLTKSLPTFNTHVIIPNVCFRIEYIGSCHSGQVLVREFCVSASLLRIA